MQPLTPTLAADVTPLWDDFAHRFHSDRSGDQRALDLVIEADPTSAVPHAIAAVYASLGSPSYDAAREAAAAESGRAAQPWERSLAGVAVRHVREGRWAAYDDWQRHTAEHPADLVGLTIASFLLHNAALPDRYDAAEAMLGRARRTVGDEPAVLGGLAMLAQERGDLDAAHRHAVAVLERDPGSYRGAHPLAHVYFESGDHAEGLTWLDGWLAGDADAESDWFPHLTWHSALHVLGLGDGAGAVDRYTRCSSMVGATSLPDRTSLLWRCQLHGLVDPGSDPGERPALELVQPLVAETPSTFMAVHVALGLAGAGDADGLRRYARAVTGMAAPGAGELVPPVATALASYVDADFTTAADLLAACEPDSYRLGGSRAQREVLEDTLIESLIRAGRLEEATARLQARLDRRESVLDRRWAARARPLSSPA